MGYWRQDVSEEGMMINAATISQPVRVMRGTAGPFAGMRLGDVVAYDFALDDSFTPRPGLARWRVRASVVRDLR
jgi:hypothetical protein